MAGHAAFHLTCLEGIIQVVCSWWLFYYTAAMHLGLAAHVVLVVAHYVSLIFVIYLTRAHSEELAVSRAATLNRMATSV